MNWLASLRQGAPRLVSHLPARYQDGKMPYFFFFMCITIVVLLIFMDSFCFNIDFYFLHTLALGGEAASPDFSSGIQRTARPDAQIKIKFI